MSKGYYDRKRKQHITIVIVGLAALLLAILAAFVIKDMRAEANKGYGRIGDVEVDQEDIYKTPKTESETPLRCLVMDVGDALAVLVDYGDKEVLYDCGYARNGEKVSETISPYVNDSLDYLILSHSHADHIGGAARICEDYNIGTAITSGETEGTSQEFETSMAALKREGCDIIEDKNMTFDLGEDATLNICEVYDPGDFMAGDNPNNYSVVAYITTGSDSILLTGDCESPAERKLKGSFEDITVFIAGHHMSKTSNNALLLDEWNPEYIIASCAGPDKSEYGFPHEEALARCLEATDNIYATYISGDILLTITKDDVKLSCDDEEQLSLQ